jgi:hypothetical protein
LGKKLGLSKQSSTSNSSIRRERKEQIMKTRKKEKRKKERNNKAFGSTILKLELFIYFNHIRHVHSFEKMYVS